MNSCPTRSASPIRSRTARGVASVDDDVGCGVVGLAVVARVLVGGVGVGAVEVGGGEVGASVVALGPGEIEPPDEQPASPTKIMARAKTTRARGLHLVHYDSGRASWSDTPLSCAGRTRPIRGACTSAGWCRAAIMCRSSRQNSVICT